MGSCPSYSTTKEINIGISTNDTPVLFPRENREILSRNDACQSLDELIKHPPSLDDEIVSLDFRAVSLNSIEGKHVDLLRSGMIVEFLQNRLRGRGRSRNIP